MAGRLIASIASLMATGLCWGQTFPDRPIRVIIPYAAGGSSDAPIRFMTTRAEAQLGQPVVVENRPGANAMIGSNAVAQAPADGYTLLWTFPASISRIFVKAPPFDVRTDFVAASGMCMTAHTLAVSSSLGAKTLTEFVDIAKKSPGKLNYAISANSTMLPMEMFKSIAGLDIVGVPYKGSAPATQALMAGEVQAIFGLLASFRALEASGKVRVLASIAPRRQAAAPDLPTFAELGYPNVVLPQSTFFLARRGTPEDRVSKLSAALTTAAATPEIEKACVASGGEAVVARGAALQKHLDDEMERWAGAAARAKFQPTE